MTGPSDALAPLNDVLNEVIDVARDARDARWRFSAPAALHAELAGLFEDARSWSRLLIEQDEAHGVSPLGLVPTAAGRQGDDLGPEAATVAGVREALDHVLGRLGLHVAAVLDGEQDPAVRAALGEVAQGVVAHRKALAAL
jgi:hypothetical protein